MSSIPLDAVPSTPQSDELLRTAPPRPIEESASETDRFRDHLRPQSPPNDADVDNQADGDPAVSGRTTDDDAKGLDADEDTSSDPIAARVETVDPAATEPQRSSTGDEPTESSESLEVLALESVAADSNPDDVPLEIGDEFPSSHANQVSDDTTTPVTDANQTTSKRTPGGEAAETGNPVTSESPQAASHSNSQPAPAATGQSNDQRQPVLPLVEAEHAAVESATDQALPADAALEAAGAKSAHSASTSTRSDEQNAAAEVSAPSVSDQQSSQGEKSTANTAESVSAMIERPTADGESAPLSTADASNEQAPEMTASDAATSSRKLREQILSPKSLVSPDGELRTAEQTRFVQRVTRAFAGIGNRGGEVRLKLSPPELGSLKISLRIEEGSLSARVETDTAMARNALMDNLTILRERLAEQGVRIDQFQVDVSDQNSGRQLDEQIEQQPHEQNSNAEHEDEQDAPEVQSTVTISDDNLDVVV